MNMIMVALLALSSFSGEVLEKKIFPTQFNYVVAPNQPEATIGGNKIYDLNLKYTVMSCAGMKLKSTHVTRSTDNEGNTIYNVSLNIEIPNPMITLYCPEVLETKIENINKGMLDVNPRFFFEASL